MEEDAIVYVVDDDAVMRSSLEFVCRTAGLQCVTYASAVEFVNDDKPERPSCLVLDLRLNGESGLDIVQAWADRGQDIMPVIVVSGTGGVPDVVRSMKLGVMDYLEKPADPAVLLARLREAIAADAARRRRDADRREVHRRLSQLTQRERELVELVCSGLSNKQIALKLNISVKTVANHRAHVLAKVNAVNTADMVRLAVLARAA